MVISGLGFGDEIIVPPLPTLPDRGVLLGGGLPVFAEVDDNLCLTAEGIEQAITPNTKGVLLVHAVPRQIWMPSWKSASDGISC